MANPLGELFGNIAASIRKGLGDVGKMKPSSFPSRIEEIVGMSSDDTEEINNILDEINGEVVGETLYNVTFASYDGTEVHEVVQVVENDICPSILTKPIRESTVQYEYSFTGWSTTMGGEVNYYFNKPVTEDITLYAVYKSYTRKYTISYYDGSTLLESKNVAYGDMPYIANPTKYGYMFINWEPKLAVVTGDASYYATWAQNSFSAASWDEIAAVSESGKASKMYNIGDEKTMYCDGQMVAVKIAGFNHDTLSDGTGKKAGITIILSTVWNEEFAFNVRQYNDPVPIWVDCELRTAIANLFSKLPTDLQPHIKTVAKEYETRNSLYPVDTSLDKLWAVSRRELGYGQYSSGLGEKYDCYEWGVYKKLTKYGNTTGVKYFVRDNFNVSNWKIINEEGNGNFAITHGEKAYLHFGFCI